MTTFTEGAIRITFPSEANARKFDDAESHGLTHCMKSVDFVVEEAGRTLFIEIKDPESPRATPESREEFIAKFESELVNEELKYKYRDSFLYQWARGGIRKKIHYWVLVAMDGLTEAELIEQTRRLKRNLPLDGMSKGGWRRPIAHGCMIFNIRMWNEFLPDYPVSRIAP